MIYQKYLKRILDFTLSTVGLIILSPVYGILVIAIKADSKGPILFKQKRVGIHKQHFNIYKFRTMSIDTPKDTPTHMLKNPDQYITKVGKFLRKTSLDELPQIFNIIKGEMSIIGPRPALWNQEDLIAERDQYGANDVRPGLTGLAQISGRDGLPTGQRNTRSITWIPRGTGSPIISATTMWSFMSPALPMWTPKQTWKPCIIK